MERDPALTSFYKSQAWRRTRAAYLESVNHICERCGRPAVIVHHKRYLTPEAVNDPDLALSFDNLEALCRDCHNKEHFEGKSCEPGLYFDSDGNLVSTKRKR